MTFALPALVRLLACVRAVGVSMAALAPRGRLPMALALARTGLLGLAHWPARGWGHRISSATALGRRGLCLALCTVAHTWVALMTGHYDKHSNHRSKQSEAGPDSPPFGLSRVVVHRMPPKLSAANGLRMSGAGITPADTSAPIPSRWLRLHSVSPESDPSGGSSKPLRGRSRRG